MSRHTFTAIALTFAAAACGPARNSPATQATIKAFDAAKSDPKALAIADQVLTAVGGEANWAKAKQIEWSQAIIVDGKAVDFGQHVWDRWNARHHYEHLEPKGQWDVTMYEMFGGVSYAYFENKKSKGPAVKEEKVKLVDEARKRFERDSYRMFLPFKLKDPGVHLAYAEEMPEEGSPQGSPMKYDEIKITFEPGVGPAPGDTWYLVVDKASHLPTIIEHVAQGKPDNEREGIKLDNWVEASGLKFATQQTTLGYTKPDAAKVPVEMPPEWKGEAPLEGLTAPKPGEIVVIKDIKVTTSVNEDLFIPNVNEQ